MATSFDPYQPPTAKLDAGPPTVAAAACPKCGARAASKVGFTWWGGALGPRLFHVVRCTACRAQYNGRTGGKLTTTIVVYQLVAVVVFGAAAWAWLASR